MLARAYHVFRSGLLYTRTVNRIAARRIVAELKAAGFTAYYTKGDK